MLAEIVAAVLPGARLIGSTAFVGGISSEMVLVEAELGDGSRRRLVVRRARGERGSISMGLEYRVLRAVWSAGLPVPEPLGFDDSGAVSERPYMVLSYVDGAPRVVADDGIETAGRLADVLASIHELDGSAPPFADVPERSARVARALTRRDGPVDDSIGEGRILAALRAHWPPAPPTRSALLHCDLWLGNVLWSESEIVAVIDWEHTHVGDPLVDLAITRLECAWSFGREGVAALTERYRARTGADLTELALWDLAAARRPAGELSRWAADWVSFGRPDMTPDRMRAAHRWFVEDAMAALGESRRG